MHHPLPDIPQDGGKLLFRRQFILSKDPRHMIPGGAQVLVGGIHHVSAHSDLELTHVELDGKSLTLLGFALDPDRPQSGNHEILKNIIGKLERCKDILDHTDSLGGRWALVVHDGVETLILHDATGQRQVCFHKDEDTGDVTCASESGILAEKLGLTMDTEAVDFIQSRGTDDYEIYWMPGDTTLFKGIKALLPNHYLSLADGCSHRFPPVKAPDSFGEPLAECLRLLRGSMEAARQRFPLSVPMTAGWDSRLMLALAKEDAGDLHAFTLAYPHLPVSSRDVAVPARLLVKLGIPHHVVSYPERDDESFRKIFRRNNVSANDAYCRDIEALHASYPDDRLCATGDAAEIVKCYYQRDAGQTGPVSATELADFSRLGRHPFVLKAFTRWLEEAGDSPVDLLDLFCWEQMAGRWQAKVRAEYDMVQESFAPLNNRKLLGLMLSMDRGLRKGPEFRLFTSLIEALWPEVLSEPINPPERVSLPRRAINLLKRTGILRFIPDSARSRLKAALHLF